MAFSVVAATNTSVDINGEPTVISLPSGIVAGNLLIVWMMSDGFETISDWDGFTELFVDYDDTSQSLWAAYKFATGSEGSTISVGISSAERTAHQSFRITGAHATTPPEVATGTDGSTEFPDPPSLTPSWGAEDTLWMVGLGIDTGAATVDSYPTSYTNGVRINEGTGSGGANLAVARRENNTATEDPGTFDLSGVEGTVINTLAIRPAGAAAIVIPSLIMSPYRTA